MYNIRYLLATGWINNKIYSSINSFAYIGLMGWQWNLRYCLLLILHFQLYCADWRVLHNVSRHIHLGKTWILFQPDLFENCNANRKKIIDICIVSLLVNSVYTKQYVMHNIYNVIVVNKYRRIEVYCIRLLLVLYVLWMCYYAHFCLIREISSNK